MSDFRESDHPRDRSGSPTAGRFVTAPRAENPSRLVSFDDLGAESRQAVISDLIARRDKLGGQVEGIREQIEELEAQRDEIRRQATDLSNQIADLQAAAPTSAWATPYEGPDVVLTEVRVDDYPPFQLSRSGYNEDPDYIRVQVDRELDQPEQDALASMVAYAFKPTGGGDLDDAVFDSPNSIIMRVEPTRRDFYPHLADRFEPMLEQIAYDGTPVRTTNRSGQAGTRAIEGLGIGQVHVYYAND